MLLMPSAPVPQQPTDDLEWVNYQPDQRALQSLEEHVSSCGLPTCVWCQVAFMWHQGRQWLGSNDDASEDEEKDSSAEDSPVTAPLTVGSDIEM